MTEQTVTLPAEPQPVEPAPPKARRTLGLPVVAAIAGATLLIGGLAGGIIGYAVHSDGPDFGQRPDFNQRPGLDQRGPGQQFRQGGPGQQGGPGNGNQPQPPTDGSAS